MFRKIPLAGTKITLSDLGRGFKSMFSKKSSVEQFEKALSNFVNTKYCFTLNSGQAAFYIVLKSLQHFSDKKEVILPAYTAPSLILAIRKAHLKVVLCDISAETFNLDINLLPEVITEDTLCIVPVHLFGIPCELREILALAKKEGIFVFEDSAQAMGTYLNGKMVGTIGDVSCYSFNRGKNFPLYSGGCIVTNSAELAGAIKNELKLIKPSDISFKASLPFKMAALSLVVNPVIYRLFYSFISPFKSTTIYKDFEPLLFTKFQAAVGLSQLKKLQFYTEKRYRNGSLLYQGLKEIEQIIPPKIIPRSRPAYMRMPIVFKDINLREKIQSELFKEGIETSKMYLKPVHHHFELGYQKKKEPFPNATYFAHRVLTLPTHPLVDEKALQRIISVFKDLK